MKPSFFERHAKITLLFITTLFLLGGVTLINYLAGKVFGLGKIVVYESNPIYGYRPVAQQDVTRHPNTPIKINNLGLRANKDWDSHDFAHKILFLGDSVTYGGSYIANDQLFSSLVAKSFPKFETANAGVNGWGVNNVHAFVKELQFLPAQVYVSVFPEGDFYRGLNRIGGQPFWTHKPDYALEELFQYFIYKLQLKKAPGFNINTASNEEKMLIVDIAARNLKDLDKFLKDNNRDHLIFITPSLNELQGITKQDEIIKSALLKYGLQVIYIKDYLGSVPETQIKAYYHDDIHLSEMGHQKWAELISVELKDIVLHREKESLFVENKPLSKSS